MTFPTLINTATSILPGTEVAILTAVSIGSHEYITRHAH